MSELTFSDRPSIELLQWLARGSLRQNLRRAVRLWVFLQTLYGDEPERASLNEPFTYAMWRDAFFSPTHPTGEAIPTLHDPNCPCAKTIADWLFNSPIESSVSQWKLSLQQHGSVPDDLEELLVERLFGVTRRSLATDLKILTELGWLHCQNNKYYRVWDWPSRPVPITERFGSRLAAYELNFLHPDLAVIADNLSQVGHGERFFLHLDYVVAPDSLDKIDDWQNQLRQIWEQSFTPCLLLTYNSASLERVVECVVYPVCIYYVQRATYLCAFGRNPSCNVNWYNYRLDRIQQLIPLAWTDARIPQQLMVNFQNATLPTPEYIQSQMAQAWGFDFYRTAELMLLRFERIHHQHYIERTFRHETFERISYERAVRLVEKHAQGTERQALLTILSFRSREDAYYQVFVRQDDPFLKQRLGSWRPFVEVFLPFRWRKQIEVEVKREWQLYSKPSRYNPQTNKKFL